MIASLAQLTDMFSRVGCRRLYAKQLAPNDNSKNQVYFGPGFESLNLFPNKGVEPDGRPGNPTFKARLDFGWLREDGSVAPAPHAQLILYPQYPEVRFSGFLRGCVSAPAALMASRDPRRILFLGVTPDGKVVGFVASDTSAIGAEFGGSTFASASPIFVEIVLSDGMDEAESRARLLSELRRIHALQWIASKQLRRGGVPGPCNAPQCGGFTLEAELGIPKNSAAEPDYLGWEVKQHSVSGFDRPATAKPITLMTPEPTGGVYREAGPEAFVRRFGYPDQNGVANRLNFGGRFRVGRVEPRTGLTLQLVGYDFEDGKVSDPKGAVALISSNGDVAASWSFAGLLSHWSRKHSKAVYVPSMCRTTPGRAYAYGPIVRLAEGTDSNCLLQAFATGNVYYDPGIKLEHASNDPTLKRRSQFRIASRDISMLYRAVAVEDVRLRH